MKFCSILLIVFLFLTINCSSISSKEKEISISNNSQNQAANNLRSAENPPVADSNLSNNKLIKEQANQDDFLVKTVDDKERNAQNVHTIVSNASKWVIKMPSFEDVNNFAVDQARKNDEGFEIQVEYGTRYKYDKTFYFVKKAEEFYFTQIKIKSFDGNNPQK